MSMITKPIRLEKLLEDQKKSGYFESQSGTVLLVGDLPEAGARTLSAGLFGGVLPQITSTVATGTVFDPHVPNAETEAAILEARAGIGLTRIIDRDELFKQLND